MLCCSMNTPTTVIYAWRHSYIGTFTICGRYSFVLTSKATSYTHITENPIKSTCLHPTQSSKYSNCNKFHPISSRNIFLSRTLRIIWFVSSAKMKFNSLKKTYKIIYERSTAQSSANSPSHTLSVRSRWPMLSHPYSCQYASIKHINCLLFVFSFQLPLNCSLFNELVFYVIHFASFVFSDSFSQRLFPSVHSLLKISFDQRCAKNWSKI